jgi:hypothetical protein
MHYYTNTKTVRVFDAHDQNEAMERFPRNFTYPSRINGLPGPLGADGEPQWIDFKEI